jgi:hypothetical protein
MVGDEVVVVRPMVLAQRARVVAWLRDEAERVAREQPELAAKAKAAGQAALADNLQTLRPILDLFGERIAGLYSLLFGREPSWWLETLDLKAEAELWDAFLEVNQVPFVVGLVRSLSSRFRGRTPSTVSP